MAECRVCGEPYQKEQDALDCYLGHYERHGPCPDAEDCWVCVEKGLASPPSAASARVIEPTNTANEQAN